MRGVGSGLGLTHLGTLSSRRIFSAKGASYGYFAIVFWVVVCDFIGVVGGGDYWGGAISAELVS